MIKINKNQNELETKDSFAFMGLSLGKMLFQDKKVMEAYAKFLSDNFSEAFFFIADLPKRYNIMAIEGLSEDKALERIKKGSNNLLKFIESVSEKYPNLSVKIYRELQDESYRHNLEILNKTYLEDHKFRHLLRRGVVDFLSLPNNKKKIESSDNSFEKSIDIAINYRLDELAMLLSLPCNYEEIYEIYPGVDELHEMLHDDKFGFCKDLKKNQRRKFLEVHYED